MLTREQAHELLDLCLDINGEKKRKKLLTGELPTTFLYFSGHTCDVDISVHENGWEPNANADKDFTVYFNEVYGDRYEEVKEYLLELKKKTV